MKFIAAIALLIAGCSASMPSTVAIRPPVPTAPVAPVAARVKTEIVVVKESNKAIENGLGAAINKLSRLSQQKSATEKELADLWDTLTGVKSRVSEQWLQLAASEKTIDELNIAANLSDSEITTLRSNLIDANSRFIAAAEWQTKHAKKVAVYDWIHSRLWWLAAMLAIGGIIYAAIKNFTRKLLPI